MHAPEGHFPNNDFQEIKFYEGHNIQPNKNKASYFVFPNDIKYMSELKPKQYCDHKKESYSYSSE